MKFPIQYVEPRAPQQHYHVADFEIAKTFASRVYKEFGEFVRAIILFGSAAKEKKTPGDIDILIVLDDVRIIWNEEIVQTYRIVLQRVIAETDLKKLHVQSMKFTSFWEYLRAGDPVAINILRYGVALIDTGFFDPLQMLLDQGRIRPTPEAISTYFGMAPGSIERARGHLIAATIDLYWAAINATHAALMHHGEIPPSPEHVPDILQRTLGKEKKISLASLKTMKELYTVYKGLTGREKKEVTGREYDLYRKKTEKLVKEMEKYIQKKKKKA